MTGSGSVRKGADMGHEQKPKRSSLKESHEFVLEQSKLNVQFIKADPRNVAQGKQINGALANIVASERNIVMRDALDRALKNDQDLPRLP